MVISSRPCGGSSRPSCMQIRNITPNHTGSTPRLCTTGMKIGRVISIMLTWSRNSPRKISSSIMPATIASAATVRAPRSAARCRCSRRRTSRICANVVAPRMMNRIIPDIAAVPRSDLSRASKRERAVRHREQHGRERRRVAADSVGVAQPRATSRRPRRRRSTPAAARTGRTARSCSPAAVFLERGRRRELGVDLHPHDDVGDERHARGSAPAMMPPTSSLEIEMPDRLPSSTVSAEGGISMSTAPIAMIGPVAMVG